VRCELRVCELLGPGVYMLHSGGTCKKDSMYHARLVACWAAYPCRLLHSLDILALLKYSTTRLPTRLHCKSDLEKEVSFHFGIS
jgi:hypothetical protein